MTFTIESLPGRRYAGIRSDDPLTDEQIRRVVPAVFATRAHEDVSDRYAYLPTSELVNALRGEGFEVHMAAQSLARDTGRLPYTRHIVRMRAASRAQSGRGEFNEIALDTSHDRSRALTLRADRYRQVCGNGLVVGGEFDEFRLEHQGGIVIKDVITATQAIVGNFGRIDASRDAMNAIELTPTQREDFARSACALRWRPGVNPAPISAQTLLTLRNYEETPNTLWATFNIVQRNLVGGGNEGTTPTGRRTTTGAIRGIDGNTRLNRALWELAAATAANHN
ncbi:DUF932 domain-containing protein [Nocardia takedensis]|uniref:DUF932 domain-containing protein n=1 Tax=Nocardia takedensis TaxID=259390 RepID=UPI003F76AB18